MVARDETHFELLLLLLLLQSIEGDDPLLRDVLYSRIERSELLDPELAHLLQRHLRDPRWYRSRRREESREIATSVLEGFRQSIEQSTNTRINKLDTTIRQVADESEHIKLELASQREALTVYKRDSQDYFWLLASGVDIRAVSVTRYIPVRAYISDPVPERATLSRILSSLEYLLDDAGFEKADDFPEESGSWWKRFVLRTKDPATQKEVIDRLQKVERAAEIAYLDKPQAEANQCQAQAASSLINALKETENACIQAGSLLVVKATSNAKASIIVRTLTPIEIRHLEENQAILRRPEDILDWLQGAEKRRITKAL